MKTASLLGSAVAKRAISNFLHNSFTLPVYAPKSSIASLFSEPVEFSNQSIFKQPINIFNEITVTRDLKGDFLKEMSDKGATVLFVDFFDEVHDLYAHKEKNICVTNSNYLKVSNFEGLIDENWEKVALGSPEYWKRWRLGCENLSKNLPKDVQVILLEIFLPESFKNTDKGVSKYSERKLKLIRQYNSTLRKNYSYFKEMLTCKVITVPNAEMICQTPESDGNNFTNINDSYCQKLAMEISEQMGLTAQLGNTLEEKIDNSINSFHQLIDLDSIPSIRELHSHGNYLIKQGNFVKAKKCEKLIQILHNSSVPLSVKIGEKTKFGYGGIGVVIHENCVIGKNVTVGSNVTLGGGKKIKDKDGFIRSVPHIGDSVYISTGAKILGGVTIGNHCIIGANSVVTKNIPSHSVVVGIPGKIITKINEENYSSYYSYFYKQVSLKDSKKLIFEKL